MKTFIFINSIPNADNSDFLAGHAFADGKLDVPEMIKFVSERKKKKRGKEETMLETYFVFTLS